MRVSDQQVILPVSGDINNLCSSERREIGQIHRSHLYYTRSVTCDFTFIQSSEIYYTCAVCYLCVCVCLFCCVFCVLLLFWSHIHHFDTGYFLPHAKTLQSAFPDKPCVCACVVFACVCYSIKVLRIPFQKWKMISGMICVDAHHVCVCVISVSQAHVYTVINLNESTQTLDLISERLSACVVRSVALWECPFFDLVHYCACSVM